MNKNTIVIFGPIKFPFGNASGNLLHSVAKAITEAGWHVLIVGIGEPRKQDRQPDNTYMIDGIQYDSIYKQNDTKIRKALKLLSGGNAFKKTWIRNGVDNPYAIISYSSYFIGNYRIIDEFTKSPSKFIVYSVEWFIYKQFKMGRLSWKFINSELGMRLYKRSKNAIVISSLLEQQFEEKVQHIFRIPPIVDTQSIEYIPKSTGEQLKLFYAGRPITKDYLHTVIQGINQLNEDEQKRIIFNICGTDRRLLHSYLASKGVDLDNSPDTIVVHGYVPRETLIEMLGNSDFLPLLRPQLRYANANFPSKVPEALAAGLPLLINYTTDFEMFIRDGYEGIIVEDCTPQAMAVALRKALALTEDELNAMRQAARTCAERNFDYRNYVEPLRAFLEKAT